MIKTEARKAWSDHRVGNFFDLKKKKSKKSDLFDLNQIFFLFKSIIFLPTTQHH